MDETCSSRQRFQLLLGERPRKSSAHQVAELVDDGTLVATRCRALKPLAQHVLEIVRLGLLIVDDKTVPENLQVVLRRFQELLHSGFHAPVHSGEQVERAVIATG